MQSTTSLAIFHSTLQTRARYLHERGLPSPPTTRLVLQCSTDIAEDATNYLSWRCLELERRSLAPSQTVSPCEDDDVMRRSDGDFFFFFF